MNISTWLIKKLHRKKVYYEYSTRRKKRLFDFFSVIYMLIEYITIISFFYNLIYGLLRITGWILAKLSITNVLLMYLYGWPGLVVNILFPIIILGFVFTTSLDVWVGDPLLFKTTFKYRVLKI